MVSSSIIEPVEGNDWRKGRKSLATVSSFPPFVNQFPKMQDLSTMQTKIRGGRATFCLFNPRKGRRYDCDQFQ